MSLKLCHWPSLPPRPARGDVIIVRLARQAPRAVLRQLAREAVLRVVQAWGHPDATLREQTDGPRLAGGGEWSVSLAYTADQAWIALTEGPAIGIDATEIRDFEGMAEVARLYLDPAASCDSPEAFATAWSRHEAALKYHRRPLTEGRALMPAPPRHLTVRVAGCAVSVAAA